MTNPSSRSKCLYMIPPLNNDPKKFSTPLIYFPWKEEYNFFSRIVAKRNSFHVYNGPITYM